MPRTAARRASKLPLLLSPALPPDVLPPAGTAARAAASAWSSVSALTAATDMPCAYTCARREGEGML